MTTPPAADAAIESHAAAPQPSDPGTRGLTRIAPNVVERVAAFACRKASGVLSESNADRSTIPPIRAQADVMGSHVHLAVRLPVEYPRPIVEVSASAREVVNEAVHRLCGLHVDTVDIEAVPINRTRRARVR